jgi:DNA-binding HxlR family transcriptional regulator
MGDNRNQEFLQMLSARGALEILKFLDEREEVQHRQMKGIINTHTLNNRIRELLEFELIQHHLEKSEKRHEWYTLTEKGKKVLEILEILIGLAEHFNISQKNQERIDEEKKGGI